MRPKSKDISSLVIKSTGVQNPVQRVQNFPGKREQSEADALISMDQDLFRLFFCY